MKQRRIAWLVGISLLVALMCVLPCAALTADNITFGPIGGDKWLIAGSGQTQTYTVLNNETKDYTNITSVIFSFEPGSEGYGSINPLISSSAPFSTQFTVGFTSGTAVIEANVTYLNDTGMKKYTILTCYQKIDHNVPYEIETLELTGPNGTSLSPLYIIPVYSNVTITVGMVDEFGNPVDSKREDDEGGSPEYITFHCPSEYPEAGFFVGSTFHNPEVSVPVNEDGLSWVSYRASQTAVENILYVDPSPIGVDDQMIFIMCEGEAKPYSLDCDVVPSSRIIRADGVSEFEIMYTARDRFGNPCPNSPLLITTDIGERQTVYTDTYGQARIRYGPKDTIGIIWITATSLLNLEKSNKLDFEFISNFGSSMMVRANPLNLASADVDNATPGKIWGRIVDDAGFGVANQNITFKITPESVTADADITSYPWLSLNHTGPGAESVTATTDEDGYTYVYFFPGGFPVSGEDNWEPYAIGSCSVTGEWNSASIESERIYWRNYPYLRVEAGVSNTTVSPGDEFDVTLYLIGDGTAITDHLPIDVVLLLDRGEDMLLEEPDRMIKARNAAQLLLEDDSGVGLTPGVDRVAYIPYGDLTNNSATFGTSETANLLSPPLPINYNWRKNTGQDGNSGDDWAYAMDNYPGNNVTQYLEYAPVKLGFDDTTGVDWSNYEFALNHTVPIKDERTGQASAPLREGLYQAITYMVNNQPTESETVRAIVLLMQNNYRWFGDPFASGDLLPYPTYPDNKGGSDYTRYAGLSDRWQNMALYAADNDIPIYAIYYPTGGSTSDENVPRRLAQETNGEYFFAGSEGELIAAFDAIRQRLLTEAGVNTMMSLEFVDFSNPDDALNWSASEVFDYIPRDPSSTMTQKFKWDADPYLATIQTYFTNWTDQTLDWYDDYTLKFNPGTIHVKETWWTTFTLRVNPDINETLNLSLFSPDAFIQYEDNQNNTYNIPLPDLEITIVENFTAGPRFNETIEVYNLIRTNSGLETIDLAWDINYTGEYDITQIIEYRDLLGHWTRADLATLPNSTSHDSFAMYVANWPPGTYTFRVTVNTQDAGFDREGIEIPLDATSKNYIKLE